MAYNRKQRLNDNIKAIETAFFLDREQRTPSAQERLLLGRYCGFGGLKCILNPAKELPDAVHWAKSNDLQQPQEATIYNNVGNNLTQPPVHPCLPCSTLQAPSRCPSVFPRFQRRKEIKIFKRKDCMMEVSNKNIIFALADII